MNFYLDGEVFYKKSSNETLLRGLDEVEAKDVLREVHEGICSTPASGHDGWKKKVDYFWTTLEKDCIDYVRKYHR